LVRSRLHRTGGRRHRLHGLPATDPLDGPRRPLARRAVCSAVSGRPVRHGEVPARGLRERRGVHHEGDGARGYPAPPARHVGSIRMDLALLIARLALALMLAVAAAAKLLDVRGAREGMRAFGAPAGLAPAMAVLVPLAELAVAVLLVPVSTAAPAAAVGLALLGAFTVAAGTNLARGRAPECNLFGALSPGPRG